MRSRSWPLFLLALSFISGAGSVSFGGFGSPGLPALATPQFCDSDSDPPLRELSTRSDVPPPHGSGHSSVRPLLKSPDLVREQEVRAHSAFDDPSSGVVRDLCRRGFLAIQSLVDARPRCDLRPRAQRASQCSLRTNAADIEERLHTTLQHYGPPSSSLPPVGSCLSDLLKGVDTVVGGEATTVRPYDSSRVKLVGAGHTAVNVEDLADPELVSVLKDPSRYLLKSETPRCPRTCPLYTLTLS